MHTPIVTKLHGQCFSTLKFRLQLRVTTFGDSGSNHQFFNTLKLLLQVRLIIFGKIIILEIQGLQSRQRLERRHEGFDTLRIQPVVCVHADSGEHERCDVVVRSN